MTNHPNRAKAAASRRIIRSDMEARGASRYRITAAGELHYFGPAPNSNTVCWWLAAQDADAYVEQIKRESLPEAFK